jgi:hypothetical protein
MRVRPIAASLAAWTAAAGAAIAVGMIALSLIGTGLNDGPIENLNATTVSESTPGVPTTPVRTTSAPAVSAPTSTTPNRLPPTTATTAAPPKSSDRTVVTHGGTVIARCVPAGAYLVGWSPAVGYQPDNIVRGPASFAHITFSNRSRDVRITITCVSGTVQPLIQEDD